MNTPASPTDRLGVATDSVRLREDLVAFLGQYELRLKRPLTDDTPLISAGALDSLALFNLVLWVEKQVGQPVDPASMNPALEWDTVRLILSFVEGFATRANGSGVRPHGGRRIGDLRIVEYSPEHRDAIAGLQAQVWSPEAALNRQYMAWKYEDNPYGHTPHLYLVLDGDQAVAMRGFYPSCWEFGPQPQRRVFFVADDLVVRDDHRSRGLVNSLMQAAYDGLHQRGIDYLLNLSGGRFTVESSQVTGWQSAGELDPMERRSPSRRRRDAVGRGLARTPALWRYISSRFLSRGAGGSAFARLDRRPGTLVGRGGVAVRVSRRAMPVDMAGVVRRIGHDGRIRHVRDESYFDWRFRNPLHDYRFFYVGEPELDGYMILKRAIDLGGANPRVCVVDLEAVDDRTRDALLECLTRHDLFEELFVWSATLSGKALDVLSGAGFAATSQRHPAPAMPKVLVRATDATRLAEDWRVEGMRLLETASWDMRMLYSMAG